MRRLIILAALLWCAPAIAQSPVGINFINSNGGRTQVGTANPLPVTGSLSITSTTLGPVAAGTATATNSDVVGCQYLSSLPTMTNTQQAACTFDVNGRLLVAATLAAETTKVIGTVNQGTSPWVVSATNLSVNIAQINGVTPLMGNGVTGTGSPRVTIASDNTAFAVNAQTTPVTSGGLIVYFVQPAASDNHVVIKAGAGQVYKVSVTNNSATVNYLRLYNATTGFNGCNSATNLVYQVAIPASTSVGGISDSWDLGMAFATGISICVTSGYATTDTTNATASAMSVNIGYK